MPAVLRLQTFVAGLAVAAVFAGCSSAPPRKAQVGSVASRAAQPASPATAPTTQAATIDQLQQILPPAEFPRVATAPTTAPAPLDAIQLYARGRAALDSGDAAGAVNFLKQALALDPNSFALRYGLAEALVGSRDGNIEALTALKQAEQLKPKHLELQTELARQYLNVNDPDHAIHHLRLAMQTPDYATDEELAALTDYMAARAYRQKGYDRAALEALQKVIERLSRPSIAIRGNRDLLMLAQRPEALFIQLGELAEKVGERKQAVVAYEVAADRRPESIDFQSRLIRVLLEDGQIKAARERAAEVVKRFRASPESLRLLRQVYRGNSADQKSGAAAEASVIVELRELVKDKPDDQALLFALVELLNAQNRRAEALSVLLEGTRASDYEIESVRRLFALYQDDPEHVDASARLLIEAHARQPDAQDELAPLWSALMQRSWQHRVRVQRLQALQVSPGAVPAKLFWVARLAQLWNRDLLARSALEESASAAPPFAPAYRLLMDRFWARDDWDEKRKIDESETLITRAITADDAPLADELRGLLLLRTNKPAEAADALARAIEQGATAPQVRIAQAAALIRAGQPTRAEQLLWKLIDDHPRFEEAYDSLFTYYYQAGSTASAARVLRTWRTADPANVNARLLEAMVLMRAQQYSTAQTMLDELFKDHADNPDVVSSARAFYKGTGRIAEFIRKLEEVRKVHPDNRVVLEHLVDIYIEEKQADNALRVLAEVRKAVAGDPDLLYYVGHLYTRVGREGITEQILSEVVKIDPAHAPASNDLGYTWADKGRNMEQAEALIRIALEAEPDNQSYLDSLGWVLYKRSKFEEAAQRLEEAVAPATFPDPVVLDHLGDALYRLGRKSDAIRQWKRSWEQLLRNDSSRADIRALRDVLQQKLKDAEAGHTVQLAPVVENQVSPAQQPASS